MLVLLYFYEKKHKIKIAASPFENGQHIVAYT